MEMFTIYSGSYNEKIQVGAENGYCIIHTEDDAYESAEMCIPTEDAIKIAKEIIRISEKGEAK